MNIVAARSKWHMKATGAVAGISSHRFSFSISSYSPRFYMYYSTEDILSRVSLVTSFLSFYSREKDRRVEDKSAKCMMTTTLNRELWIVRSVRNHIWVYLIKKYYWLIASFHVIYERKFALVWRRTKKVPEPSVVVPLFVWDRYEESARGRGYGYAICFDY